MAALRQAAAPVVQGTGIDAELPRHRASIAVVNLLSRQRHGAVADDAAALQVDLARADLQSTHTRMLDLSILVAQAGCLQAQGLAIRGDNAACVVQAAGQLDTQVARTELHELPPHVRQVVRIHAQLLASQLRCIAAHCVRSVQLQALAGTDLRAAGVEVAGTGAQADVRARNLRPSKVQPARRQAAISAGHGRTVGGNGVASRNTQLAAGGQCIVQIQAGRQHRASRGIDARSGARGLHADIVLRADHATVRNIALCLHLAVAARIHGAAVDHVARHGNAGLAARAGRLDVAAVA
ncbi:hypothetical protein D3C87_667930 [compost metagenome]